ncbi:hypothetical protein, partial [Microbacterium lacticum]|uniref:hypothetical protein n=1 Tax=Microbacterium lacticum TaxID=33885 RepID=UPI001F5A982E
AQMQVLGGWRQAWRTGAWVDALTTTIASVTAMIPLGLGLVLMTSIAFAVGAARSPRPSGMSRRVARR